MENPNSDVRVGPGRVWPGSDISADPTLHSHPTLGWVGLGRLGWTPGPAIIYSNYIILQGRVTGL